VCVVGPAADEAAHRLPGAVVQGGADLGVPAGSAMHACVPLQQGVDRVADDAQGRRGRTMVEVGVFDGSTTGQRDVGVGTDDFQAWLMRVTDARSRGDGRLQRPLGSGGGGGCGQPVGTVENSSHESSSGSVGPRASACGPRLPGAPRTKPGLHPGHPTAVGGLPASKPGLSAGTHDLRDGTVARAELIRNPKVWATAGRFGARSEDVVCFRSSQRTAVGAEQLVEVSVPTSRPPSSSGLGLRPFTAAARVRIPLGVRGFDRRWSATAAQNSSIRETSRPCSAVG